MYQHITIVGRLGRDPEMRYTPNGQAVTSFNVATDRQYTDGNGQRVKETTWFRVSVWGKQAETTNQYLKKGSMVLVDGRLTCDPKTGGPRIWKRQDGTEGASFEISANSVRFLSTRSETSAGGGELGEEAPSVPAAGEEDIPF
ncbi:single-strand binding protein [Longilinea arvoryzae]|uniref:Single-stranded DNA-binding protein n=1 Tax=Longilinea arvoryzae TaxID=360412 RepID=A0A0S7B599_9CHLR|nr:single-stranded DNA-binding protein [Longilinea arvoryzae]GAP12316.1 single-strand binding protein [Longilinea arvoryzae]